MGKLNLVNPLNPNQIIKTEDISDQINNTVDNTNQNTVSNASVNMNQSIVQNNDQNEQPSFDHLNQNNISNSESNNSKKNKILLIIISAIVILIIIVGVALFFTLGNSNNDVPREPNNSENVDNNPNNQQPTNITINNIVDNFNKNVSLFPLETGSDVKAEIEENNIKISINYSGSVLYYSFSLDNRDLSSKIMKDDELGFKVTSYIISSISSYYGHDFNATYNYINNNRNSLSSINGLGIIELDKLSIISVNIDNPVVAQ